MNQINIKLNFAQLYENFKKYINEDETVKEGAEDSLEFIYARKVLIEATEMGLITFEV